MNNNKLFILAGIGVALSAASSANAAILYNIDSFNNNNTTSTSANWIPGITTITTAANLTGTDDAGLFTLQTGSVNQDTTAGGGNRFRNTESPHNNTRETLTTDTAVVWQFGIVADAGFTLTTTDLMFDAVRATTGTQTRGYSVAFSIDGGAYTAPLTGDVVNNRNDGLNVDFMLPAAAAGATSIDFQINSTGGGIEWTNVRINGDVMAVPEPSSAALLGLVGFAAFARRRR